MNQYDEIYEEYYNQENQIEPNNKENECYNCSSSDLINDSGTIICNQCGVIQYNVPIHGYNESYTNQPKIFYKRINYISDILKSINGIQPVENINFVFIAAFN